MSFFICPICGNELKKTEKTYVCINAHSFDISKKGYVNLLMASGKGKTHGDDRLMLRARADFLNRGFYDRLSQRVAELVALHTKDGAMVLDAGCGEGMYTTEIHKRLSLDNKNADVVGIDISKDAIDLACSRSRDLHLAVASAAKMPVKDGSADVIVSIFAPFFAEEFLRVLSDCGVIVRVFPLSRHLWELKELIYNSPYENPETDMEEAGFSVCERYELRYDMEFRNREDVESLFAMTPYFYRTRESDRKKLFDITELDCRAEFGIVIYKKK